MNLLDATVTKVLSEPYKKFNKWWVKVEYDCWGRKSEKNIMFDSKEQADSCSAGYKFLT